MTSIMLILFVLLEILLDHPVICQIVNEQNAHYDGPMPTYRNAGTTGDVVQAAGFIPKFTDGTKLHYDPNLYSSSYNYNDYGTYAANESYAYDAPIASCSTNTLCKSTEDEEYLYSYPEKRMAMAYENSQEWGDPDPTNAQECKTEADCYFQSTIPANLSQDTEVLYLRQAVFKKIDIGDLSTLPPLTTLKITYSDLDEIIPGAFDNQPSLKVLAMEGNELAELQPGTFAGLSSLKTLDLTNNRLDDIKSTCFDGLNSLKKLVIAMNNLKAIKYQTFISVPTLEILNLQSNQIESIDPKAFTSLTNLKSLQLGHNMLSTIPSSSFRPFNRRLVSLQLSGNPIVEIPRSSFRRLRKLKKLYMGECELETIYERAFRTNKLEVLDISNNQLRRLPNLGNMPTLKRITLDNNPWHCDCEITQTVNFLLRNNFEPPLPELVCVFPPRLLHQQAMELKTSVLCPPPGSRPPTINETATDSTRTIIDEEPSPDEYPFYEHGEILSNKEEIPTRGGWVYEDVTSPIGDFIMTTQSTIIEATPPNDKMSSVNPKFSRTDQTLYDVSEEVETNPTTTQDTVYDETTAFVSQTQHNSTSATTAHSNTESSSATSNIPDSHSITVIVKTNKKAKTKTKVSNDDDDVEYVYSTDGQVIVVEAKHTGTVKDATVNKVVSTTQVIFICVASAAAVFLSFLFVKFYCNKVSKTKDNYLTGESDLKLKISSPKSDDETTDNNNTPSTNNESDELP